VREAVSEADEEIFTLVAKATGVPRTRLSVDTDLYGDLGVTGDDASELLATLAGEKAVDLSAMKFGRHFTGEAIFSHGKWLHHVLWTMGGIVVFVCVFIPVAGAFSIPYPFPEWGEYLFFAVCAGWVLAWAYVGNLLLPSARKWRHERIPVTIQDLMTAAKEKRWPINYEGQVTT
jgi:hypothetical protein